MALQLFKIADVTVENQVSSINFANIPQGYTDLIIKTSNRTNTNATWLSVTSIALNNLTTNQTSKNLLNIDGAAASNSGTTFYYWTEGDGSTGKVFSNSEFYIPNYTSSNYKSISLDHVTENNGTSVLLQMSALLWSSTAAITSITFNYSNFMADSTFTLYGVL